MKIKNMTAADILKVLEEADYRELVKAFYMFETGHLDEDAAEEIYEAYMEDDEATTLFDLARFL